MTTRDTLLIFRGLPGNHQDRPYQRPFYRRQTSVPYVINPMSNKAPSRGGGYRIQEKRRGSTPSPTGLSSCSLLSGDIYDNFHTNSLGRGQTIHSSSSTRKDHFNDMVLHGSSSPLLKRYTTVDKN